MTKSLIVFDEAPDVAEDVCIAAAGGPWRHTEGPHAARVQFQAVMNADYPGKVLLVALGIEPGAKPVRLILSAEQARQFARDIIRGVQR